MDRGCSMSRTLTLATWIIVSSLHVACDGGSPTAPSPGGASVTLAPGQAVTVPGTPLTLTFIGVASDSRCPADAVCIWLGEAVAVLDGSMASPGASRFDLRTSDAGRVEHLGNYRIELVTLAPYPYSDHPIDPADYRLTLHVEAR